MVWLATAMPGRPERAGWPGDASIVPLKDIWVTANFKETQLEHMRPGQHVEVEVDALGGQKFNGKVTSIGGATGARFQPSAS